MRTVVTPVLQRSHGSRRLRRWQFQIARHITPIAAVDSGNRRYFVDTSDYGVGLALFTDGAFETEVVSTVFEVLTRTVGHPFQPGPKAFLDIGANIGTVIIQAVCDFGAAGGVAYEPEPRNFGLLQCNIFANSLEDRVTCVRAGVSNRLGSAELSLSSDNAGDHRIVTGREQDEWGESGRPTSRVQLTSLDHEVQRGRYAAQDVGLVWMDTQGHEGRVLEGATKLLAASVPMVIEYWPYGLAATEGVDALNRLIRDHFSAYVNLAQPFAGGQVRTHPPQRLDELAQDLARDRRWANLVLLP